MLHIIQAFLIGFIVGIYWREAFITEPWEKECPLKIVKDEENL